MKVAAHKEALDRFESKLKKENQLAGHHLQDHKRAFDNDKGPNTGGMGAISPSPHMTEQLTNEVMKRIILPTIKGMKSENIVEAAKQAISRK